MEVEREGDKGMVQRGGGEEGRVRKMCGGWREGKKKYVGRKEEREEEGKELGGE